MHRNTKIDFNLKKKKYQISFKIFVEIFPINQLRNKNYSCSNINNRQIHVYLDNQKYSFIIVINFNLVL